MMPVAFHTPGPWRVGPYFDNDGSPELIIEHQTPHGNMVVAVALPGIVGQAANGLLIAADPDLLAFAEWVLSLKTGGLIEGKARQIVATAKGESIAAAPQPD